MILSLFKKLIKNRQFRVYVCVGSSAFVIEYVIFTILNHLDVYVAVSQSTSFLAGFVISFLGSRLLTFKSASFALSQSSQLWRYMMLAAVNLLLSNIVIYVLIQGLHIYPSVSKILVMAMIILWNYAIFSRIIFRQE